MNRQIEYRNLRPTDYDEIVRVWNEADLPARLRGRDSRERLIVEMERSPDFFIGAFDDVKMVGLVIGTYDGRRGMINRLAVVPGYREAGVGARLVEICEERLRKAGATIISALIEKNNIGSIKIFQRLGYRVHEDIVYVSKRDFPDA